MSDKTQVSLDEALLSGDPELMEQALAQQAGEEDVFVEVDGWAEDKTVSSGGQADEPAPAQEPKAEAVAAPEGEQQAEEGVADDLDRVIVGKSGKHEIPYSVLEQERHQRQEAERALEAERTRNQELEQQRQNNETAISNARQQLEAKGMDVEQVFSDPNAITDETWKEIAEDYGPLGRVVKALFDQKDGIQQAQAIQQSPEEPQHIAADPLQVAIQENADLSSWQTADPDRWAQAVSIDTKLRQDPAWANKPMADRFAEVAKQTKQAFGDDLQFRAQAIIDKTQPNTPSSLSDIGKPSSHSKPLAERVDSMSDADLMSEVGTMSESDLDDIFARGFS